MSDDVTSAFITVGGTVLVAVVSVIAQALTTRFVMRAEREKTFIQIQHEHDAQKERMRKEIIIETLSELLSETDPQIKSTFNYGRVVSLIHRTQLLLNPSDEEQRALNNAVNILGFELQAYIPHHTKPFEAKIIEVQSLLKVHAEVAKLSRTVVWQ